MNGYIVELEKYTEYYLFIRYLEKNNIFYEYLEGLKLFILQIEKERLWIINEFKGIKHIAPNIKLKVKRDEPVGENFLRADNNFERKQYKNWGIKKIKAPCMWNRGITGKGIKVAVLDTGIEPDPRYYKIKGEVSFVKGQGPEDTDGHGTRMAGIIAANNFSEGVVGVAWECDLYNVKVLDEDELGVDGIVFGLDWCIKNKMDVVNMSISIGDTDQPIPETVQKIFIGAMSLLEENGTVVVGTTGNNGKYGLNFPASISQYAPNLLAVGAVNQQDKRLAESNYGPGIFCVAPGEDIVTTDLNGELGLSSGTSPAAACVSGAVALLKSENPSRTPSEIKKILINNAVGIGTNVDSGEIDYDEEYGYGRISLPIEEYTLKMTTSKSIYICGEKGFIDILVLDKNNKKVDKPIRIEVQYIIPSGRRISSERIIQRGSSRIEFKVECGQQSSVDVFGERGHYEVIATINEEICIANKSFATGFRVVSNVCANKRIYGEKYEEGSMQEPESDIVGGIVTSRSVYSYGTQNELIYLAKDIESQPLADVYVDFLIMTPSNKQIITEGKTNEKGEIRLGINTGSIATSYQGFDILLDEIGSYQVETVARKSCKPNLLLPYQIEVVRNKLKIVVVCKKLMNCNRCNLQIIVLVKDEIGRGVEGVKTELIQKGCCTSYVVGSATSNKEGISYIKGFGAYYSNCENLEIKASKEGYEIGYVVVR